MASTGKGICNLSFVGDKQQGLQGLNECWPNATLTEGKDEHMDDLGRLLTSNWKDLDEIKLHIHGTDFQLKVWEALLKIPMGQLATYSDIAQAIDNPNASRAVGSALATIP